MRVIQAYRYALQGRPVRVHMGRVNTRNRMLAAKAMGCDSADGTYLAYGPDQNLPSLLAWLCEPVERSALQMDLFDLAAGPVPAEQE